LITALKVLFPS